MATVAAFRTAAMMDDPVDIVNAMIGELQQERMELPAYSTLHRMADRAHAAADRRLFSWVIRHLSNEWREKLNELLTVESTQRLSAFQAVKASAKKATLAHLKELLNHLQWLESLGQMEHVLAGIPLAKLRAFAREAKALDVAELRDYGEPQRLTLMLCLVQQVRVRTRDEIAEKFLRRMMAIHRRAKDELHRIQLEQRERTERLIETLDSLLEVLSSQHVDSATAVQIRTLVGDKIQIEELRADCAAIRAWSKNNYLPLLWNHYRSHRKALLRVLQALRLETATTDDSLLRAIGIILGYAARPPRYIDPNGVDLTFASDRWKKLMLCEMKGIPRIDRRQLEVCVLSYLMAELRSGDLTVWGSESFGDYREQLLPQEECRKLLNRYCDRLSLPKTAAEFVAYLQDALAHAAQRTDSHFLQNDQLSINTQASRSFGGPKRGRSPLRQ